MSNPLSKLQTSTLLKIIFALVLLTILMCPQPKNAQEENQKVYEIAYWKDNNIWIVNDDGSNPHQITMYDDVNVSHPEWSPDGNHLYYWTYQTEGPPYHDYNFLLYEYNFLTKEEKQIVIPDTLQIDDIAIKAGEIILLHNSKFLEGAYLSTIDLETGEIIELGFVEGDNFTEIKISPDRSTVILVIGYPHTYVYSYINLDTLKINKNDLSGLLGKMEFFPDGKNLALVIWPSHGPIDLGKEYCGDHPFCDLQDGIYKVNIDTKEAVPLVLNSEIEGGLTYFSIDVSPQGDRILYGVENFPNSYIDSKNVITGETKFIAIGRHPAWRPLPTNNLEPVKITNIRPEPNSGSLKLEWEKSESISNIAEYDIRYLDKPINDSNWEEAIQVSNPPIPPNTELVIDDISNNTEWYFRIRYMLEDGQTSALSEGVSIIDTGFRPEVDGFKFTNTKYTAYSSSNEVVNLDDLRNIFGEEKVCLYIGRGQSCTYKLLYRKWYRIMNRKYQDGKGFCFGMATGGQLLFDVSQNIIPESEDFLLTKPQNINLILDGEKTVYRDLELPEVFRFISYFHVLQQTDPVFSYLINQKKESTPSSALIKLRNAFIEKTPMIIAIVQNQDGHALIPISITYNGNNLWKIITADSNFPGKFTEVIVDSGKNTWQYRELSENEASEGFFLVPISLILNRDRSLTIKDSFIFSSGVNHLLISDSQSRHIGYQGNQFVNEIPDAEYFPILSGYDHQSDPIYILPPELDYTVSINDDSTGDFFLSKLDSENSIIVEGKLQSTGTNDYVSFSSNGDSFSYQSGSEKEINVDMATFDDDQNISISFIGLDIGGKDKVTISHDPSSQAIEINNQHNKQYGAYEILLEELIEDEYYTFEHANIELGAGSMHKLVYGQNQENDNGIRLFIDEDGDGAPDKEKVLRNEDEEVNGFQNILAEKLSVVFENRWLPFILFFIIVGLLVGLMRRALKKLL